MKKFFSNKFVDYVVTVIAIGGGIVGLKVIVNILASKFMAGSQIMKDISGVFNLM